MLNIGDLAVDERIRICKDGPSAEWTQIHASDGLFKPEDWRTDRGEERHCRLEGEAVT